MPHPPIQHHVDVQVRTDLNRFEYTEVRVQEWYSDVCLILTLFCCTGMGGYRREAERRMASRSSRAGVAGRARLREQGQCQKLDLFFDLDWCCGVNTTV